MKRPENSTKASKGHYGQIKVNQSLKKAIPYLNEKENLDTVSQNLQMDKIS